MSTDIETDQGDRIPEATPAIARTGFQPVFPPLPSPDTPPLVPNANGDRDVSGRFVVHNRASVGHAHGLARKVALLRRTLLRASTPERMTSLVEALFREADKGDAACAKLILQYTLGPPQSLDILTQIARLEGVLLKGVSSG